MFYLNHNVSELSFQRIDNLLGLKLEAETFPSLSVVKFARTILPFASMMLNTASESFVSGFISSTLINSTAPSIKLFLAVTCNFSAWLFSIVNLIGVASSL